MSILEDDAHTSEGDAETYERFRSYIEHENHLVNFRVGWLTAIESILFFAFGSALAAGDKDHAVPTVFLVTLSIVGMGVSALAAISVECAYWVIRKVEKDWKALKIESEMFPPITAADHKGARRYGHAFARALPIFLLVAWCWLGIYALLPN